MNGFKINSKHFEDKLYGLNTQCERFYPIKLLLDDVFIDAKCHLNVLLQTLAEPAGATVRLRRSPSIPSRKTAIAEDDPGHIPASYNTVNPRMRGMVNFLAGASGGEYSRVKYQILVSLSFRSLDEDFSIVAVTVI